MSKSFATAGLKDGFRHITDKHGNNKLTG